MTDNEIIKALECCTYHHGRCTSCPLYAEVTTVCKEKKDNLYNEHQRYKSTILSKSITILKS